MLLLGEFVEGLDVDYVRDDYTRDTLFKYVVARLLKLRVYRQIYVVALGWLNYRILEHLEHRTCVVDGYGLRAVRPLQVSLHILLYAGLSDYGGARIVRALLRELFELIGGNDTRISDYGRHALRIIIDAYRVLLYRDALKRVNVFLYGGDRFITHIRSDGDGHVPLEAYEIELISYAHYLQHFVLCELGGQSVLGKLLRAVFIPVRIRQYRKTA